MTDRHNSHEQAPFGVPKVQHSSFDTSTNTEKSQEKPNQS